MEEIHRPLTAEEAEHTYKRLQRWVMHLLSRKNYSRKELREKLSKRYSMTMVTDVLVWAEQNRWMMDEREIAERTVELLQQKNKGKRYILNYLKKRGLPHIDLDMDQELAKAQSLLDAKWPQLITQWDELSEYQEKQKFKAKLLRHLISRGFEMGIAQKAIQTSISNK